MNLRHKIKPLLIALLLCCTSPLWAAEEKEENNVPWHVQNAEIRVRVKVVRPVAIDDEGVGKC